MRITLASARQSFIPKALGFCPEDTRVPKYLNEAEDRLIPIARWKHTVARFQICISDGLITWPRRFAAIEQVAVCDYPMTPRNKWYEFLAYGPGQMDLEKGPCAVFVDRGWSPIIGDVEDGFYIKAYCDLGVDAGENILIQGTDDNGNRVLTNDGETDGENLALSVSGTQSTKVFVEISGVQKPVTRGPVRLYKVDPMTLVQTLIAVYEPGETLPIYRRSLIPWLTRIGCCENTNPCDPDKTVIVLAKLQHVDVISETDLFTLSCLPALKDMAMAVQKRERNLIQESLAYEASAIQALDRELGESEGGNVPVLRVINRSVMPPVMNLI